MSIRVSTWVWHDTTARGSDLLVLLALADIADDDGFCWPKMSVLVERVRLDRATVQRRVKALIRGELVERVERPGTSNLYRVLVPWADSSGGPQIAAPGGRTSAAPGAAPARQGVPHGRGTEPSVNDQKNRQSSETTERDFEAFWAMYPRKVGKGKARQAFTRAVKSTPASVILDGLRRQLPALQAAETRYVPHPTSWLNAERWTDEIAAPKPTRSPLMPEGW